MTYVPTELKREICIRSIVTVHYFEYMKDFIFRGEAHDFWEFLYVDKGSVYVTADENTFLLDTGDIIFHKPGEFHAMRSAGAKPPNLIAVSFLSDSPALKFFEHKYFHLMQPERNLIAPIIAEAENAFLTPITVPAVEQVILNPDAPFAAQQLILQYLELLLIEIRRSRGGRTRTDSHPRRQLQELSHSHRLEAVIDYLHTHLHEQLSIADICQHFSVSRSALHELFKAEKGTGVIEFFNHLKIEQAKEMIRHGNLTLSQIAMALGYGSLPYFSRRFKLVTGMSPHDYSVSVRDIHVQLKNGRERR